MVKIATLVAVLASLAFAGGASADTAQGHLSGNGSLTVNIGTLIFNMDIDPTSAVSDGEQVYVVQKNDKSGDCSGDTGKITILYDPPIDPVDVVTYDIACAHYSGSGRMAFDYRDPRAGVYVVVYVVDGSPDKVYLGTAPTEALATKWVNLGWQGSGAKTLLGPTSFPKQTVDSTFTITT
jgi:hypothetical protein